MRNVAWPDAMRVGIENDQGTCHAGISLYLYESIPPPNLVKIDVDGNELNILVGMKRVLTSKPIRSIHVESDPMLDAAIGELPNEHGFAEASRHFSRQGQKVLNAGGVYPANVVYARS